MAYRDREGQCARRPAVGHGVRWIALVRRALRCAAGTGATRHGGCAGGFLGYRDAPESESRWRPVALNPENGSIVWKTPHPGCGDRLGCSPAQSAAVTAIPGIVFSGGLDGHLRAYNAGTGAIIWDVDTARSYEAVNGVPQTADRSTARVL